MDSLFLADGPATMGTGQFRPPGQLEPAVPSGLQAFIKHVLPILQRAGLFRDEYKGPTLREHYGLGVPPNQFHVPEPTAAEFAPA